MGKAPPPAILAVPEEQAHLEATGRRIGASTTALEHLAGDANQVIPSFFYQVSQG